MAMQGATSAPRSNTRAVEALFEEHLADPATGWSLGAYGALATFGRAPDEPAHPPADGRLGLVTARGAVALTPVHDLTPFAYETGFSDGWSQSVALCLPTGMAAMGGRRAVAELGSDAGAARAGDRDGRLFDLGLGLAAVDVCLRSREPALIACLRAAVGRSPFETDVTAILTAGGADRVFVARAGRIEVFAGPADADGPRAHLVPAMLRLGRTHAATAPIPPGLTPWGAINPPHPARDGHGRPVPFDPARHAAFGCLLDAWGDPDLVAIRRAVLAGEDPAAEGRHARSARRAARAQLRVLTGCR